MSGNTGEKEFGFTGRQWVPLWHPFKKMRAPADWEKLEKLFPLYIKGDVQATRELFSELLRVLKGFLHLRMNGSPDIEDVAQAALLKIHFARERYDPSKSLKTWVFTIVTRTLIDHWRGSAVEDEHIVLETVTEAENGATISFLESVASEELDPERKTELHGDLNQALLKLKPIDRSIVYLYGVEGLSMAEIGESLSITEGAVKLRAHRAYKQLKEWL
jgi:RNA polymerase sigma-70 factor (ECF subfamily)